MNKENILHGIVLDGLIEILKKHNVKEITIPNGFTNSIARKCKQALNHSEAVAESATSKGCEWEKHVVEEGSRRHVLRYNSHGCYCSEPNCEINKPIKE